MTRILICVIFSIWFMPGFLLATSLTVPSTVEDICQAYPEKMRDMFEALDLDRDGLQKVKESLLHNNLPLACHRLLAYYKQSESARFFLKDPPRSTTKSTAEADAILKDIYTFQQVSGQVPRKEDGHLDWFHNGPENDIEWAWALNRHYIVRTLLDDWYQTGNAEMLTYINQFIIDWITSSWPYPGVKSSTAMWRGLEVSFRAKIWARVFFELIHTDFISPAARLLILSSLPDHAHYARNFHQQNNWLTMEISGLATVAAFWPEYKESVAWLHYTTKAMIESMKEQVYPDGVQSELTSSYHLVALDNFRQYFEICEKAGIQLPEFYHHTMEQMWSYLAFTMRPDGFGILNNDADRLSNRERILGLTSISQYPDWEYVASNGKKGIAPDTGPSFFYPWAGHLISRNAYDARAHWSFFDIGPWGSGHQHNDKLHLSVSAYGRDFLVDAGRFAYRGAVAEKFRKYATGSAGHNVILFNGIGQAPGPKLAEVALSDDHWKITEEYDYSWGSFDKFLDSTGAHVHSRALLYVRDQFWVVVDKTESNQPADLQFLWHWHPDLPVQKHKKARVTAGEEDGQLSIIPLGKQTWDIRLVKGQDNPDIQGWYSPVYNVFEPNVTSIYELRNQNAGVFVWLLFPSEGKQPKVKAKILAKDEQSVSLQIRVNGKGNWETTVPFADSRAVRLSYKNKN